MARQGGIRLLVIRGEWEKTGGKEAETRGGRGTSKGQECSERFLTTFGMTIKFKSKVKRSDEGAASSAPTSGNDMGR